MTLVRLILGSAILAVAVRLLDAAHHVLPASADGATPAARRRVAGLTAPEAVLLASIIGMAICALWIGITWRAAS